MSERISGTEFLNVLNTLGPGDEAFHGMLFPRVYPSDAKRHAELLAGRGELTEEYEDYYKFYGLVSAAKRRGAQVRRLRILPGYDQFGYDHKAIQAMLETEREAARNDLDVRTAGFDDCQDGLIEAFGPDMPLVAHYLDGVAAGESRASFWSIRRVGRLGGLAIRPCYVGLMDYEGAQFLGHEPYGDPRPSQGAPKSYDPHFVHKIPTDVLAYEQFVRDVHENADPIS
jgi:hypothetical protein